MTSRLFSPMRIGPLEVSNRIMVAPMCQYSAVNGTMTDWHLMHLGNLALSGAGMLVIEATGVTPEGRITPGCTGLYSNENEHALRRIVRFLRDNSPIRIGLQLGHAGRKASTHVKLGGKDGPLNDDEGAWPTVAASAIPFAKGWHTPAVVDRSGMDRIRDAFIAAAQRAARAGVEFIEFHCAHGFLMSGFLSSLSNRRTDIYGGSLDNRMRFPLEVFRALRSAWPSDKPIGAKINGSDFAEGGITPDEAVIYSRALRESGCDYVVLSGGGGVPQAKVDAVPGYQVPFAEQVKRETGITTGAVGMIVDPHHADSIVAQGKADFVAVARAMLFNPRWACHAAIALGTDTACVPQYNRAHPTAWPPATQLCRRD